MSDIILEILRASLLCLITVFVWRTGRKAEIRAQPGWWLIIAGFGLVCVAAVLDVTDNFPALNPYIVIGCTPWEAFLENMVGYVGGLGLCAIGYAKLMHAVSALKKAREDLKRSHEESERKVKEQTAHLERRVEERTAALTGMNAQLAVEMDRRRKVEDEHSRHKERLELALSAADLVMWDWDIARGQVMHGDPSVDRRTYTVRDWDVAFDGWKRAVHPDDWPRVHRALEDHLQGHSPVYEVEFRYRNGSGGYLWGLARGRVVDRDNAGRPLRMTGTAVDISARKKAEQALRESEEKYRHIFENSRDAIAIVDRRTLRILDANPAAAKLYGYTREELLSRNAAELSAHPDRVRTPAEPRDDGAFIRLLEATHRRKDGALVPVESSVSAFSLKNEETALFISRDISDRVRAMEQLEEAKERYRIVADFAHDWAFWIDVDGALLYMAPSCEHITGYSVKEFMDDPKLLSRIVHPDDREIYARHREQVRQFPDVLATMLDFRIVHRDGRVLWINHVCRPVAGRFGEPRGRRVSNRDITDRKQVEAELHASRQRFTSIVENSSDAILVTDLNREVLYRNPAAVRLLEYANIDPRVLNWGEPAAEGGGREVDIVRSDGLPGIAEMHAAETLWNLQPARLIILRDVTERRRYEDALRNSEERMRLVIESSPIGIEIARDGVYQYVNPAFLRMFGYERAEEVEGLPVESMYLSEDSDTVAATDHDSIDRDGVLVMNERRAVRKDGQHFDVSVRLKKIDYHGRPAVLGFVIDVSEERALRTQLVQAQKMEAIGTLSGGIAHDFNNILTVISGFTELLLLEKTPDDPEHEDLTKVASAARKGADLVQGLLAFSRKAASQPRPLDLNHEVEQVVGLLSRTLPKMITIETRFERNIRIVNADSGQIEQVLMNLTLNARDAMPDGGTLTIATENVQLDEAICRTRVGIEPGHYVRVSVSDTGHGMDAETVARIFDPFFTTKAAGRGTGLGLAIAYGIIRQHNGSIECRSTPGVGTVFDIYLPILPLETEGSPHPRTGDPRGCSETILLIDDEDLVRDLGTRLLTRSGYRVLTACNGIEALEVYARSPHDVSLVVLDLMMPKMGGKECLDGLRRINPAVKVLIASGYASDGHPDIAESLGARGFVKKPYDPVTFLKSVREALDAE